MSTEKVLQHNALVAMLDEVNAMPGMRRIILEIWTNAGFDHAVKTLRGWGAK